MKRIILLDVDKTLIDEKYRFTDDIGDEVALCKERGIEIGLCSDTPLPPLKKIAKDLALTGPIVAEFGAFVYYPADDACISLHPEKTRLFLGIRRRFLGYLIDGLPETTIFIGNNTDFVAKDLCLDSFGDYVVLVNGHRKESLAFHCKSPNSEKNGLVSNQNLLSYSTALAIRAIKTELESDGFGFDINDFWIDKNDEYGITIVHSSVTKKKNGVLDVVDRSGAEISMVGDSMYDVIGDGRVTQYWVNNALERQKKTREVFVKEGEYVSPYSYTKGVKDILRKIASESR